MDKKKQKNTGPGKVLEPSQKPVRKDTENSRVGQPITAGGGVRFVATQRPMREIGSAD